MNKKNKIAKQQANKKDEFKKVAKASVKGRTKDLKICKKEKKSLEMKANKGYLNKLKKKDPKFYQAIKRDRDVLQYLADDDNTEEESAEEDIQDEDAIEVEKEKIEEENQDEDEMEEEEAEEEEDSQEEDEIEAEETEEEEDIQEVEGDSEGPDSDTDEEEEDFQEEDLDLNEEEEEEEEVVTKTKKGGMVTKAMIKSWKAELKNTRSAVSAFRSIQQALTAAIKSIKGSEDSDLQSPYTVEGPQIFNMVIQLCLKDVAPCLHKLFELKSLSDRPKQNSKWKKLLPSIKRYLKDLILLPGSFTDSTGIEALLGKGILPMLPCYVEFSYLAWSLMKQLVSLWCTSYERVRVQAFIAIFRLIRSFTEDQREKSMKALYIAYVKNCHFTSPVSWPMINFMRMSLVELYSLDQALAYRHAFIYIRQLALHLRNAMIVQKKERMQLVYNWQFIHCLYLWADLLSRTHPSPVLQPLIYPLIQVSVCTMDLMKSPKYYPLVFHICSILTELSKSTETFILVIPPLLEILGSQHLRTRPKKISVKPLQWNSIIKVSSSQMKESAFTDGVVDQVYDHLLTYLSAECATIGFPELVFQATLKIKTFIEKCKVPNYKKKMKQLVDKIQENSIFIEERRKNVTFRIDDLKAINDWQISTHQSSPPLQVFYTQWKKVKDKNRTDEERYSSKTDEDEALIKQKKLEQAEKKIGLHLLLKRDEEEVQSEGSEDEEINNKKRRRSSSASEETAVGAKKKKKISDKTENISDKSDDVVEDIVQEMNLSDNEESGNDEEEEEEYSSSEEES